MISMNKPLDYLLKYFFLIDPPLDLFQISKRFSFKSVKCSLKISTSSGLIQWNYTCRK